MENLLVYRPWIQTNLEGCTADVVIVDLSKLFDTVDARFNSTEKQSTRNKHLVTSLVERISERKHFVARISTNLFSWLTTNSLSPQRFVYRVWCMLLIFQTVSGYKACWMLEMKMWRIIRTETDKRVKQDHLDSGLRYANTEEIEKYAHILVSYLNLPAVC